MSFSDFPFNKYLQARLRACGYHQPTPIQQQVFGPILAGRDLLGLAQTGTGKTGAFVLPLLQRLAETSGRSLSTLIIAPTRELAEQTCSYIDKFSKGSKIRSLAVYGGVSKQPQVEKLRRGIDVVVACPGRLLDLVGEGSLSLAAVKTLVLDEADHMFDKGFLPDIRRIVKLLPKKCQNLVFSATMPTEIRTLVGELLVEPVSIQIDHEKAVANISHIFWRVAQNGKMALLKHILQEEKIDTAIVFTRTKHKATSLALQLARDGHKVTSLQGDLSQQKRQQALNGFKSGRYHILVATDIAARGLDVSDISHIINFDMPETMETFTHRTGRTGRMSRFGRAMTFITEDNRRMAGTLEKMLGNKLEYREQRHSALVRVACPQACGKQKKVLGLPQDVQPQRRRTGKKSSRRNQSLQFDFGLS
jgi:ATP-dependent RNA helicase RhlE